MAEEVIITDTPFDAPTDNYEEFDQRIDSGKLGARIEQKNTLKDTQRSLQFYADNFLLLKLNNKALRTSGKNNKIKDKTINYHLNLAWISSEPIHHKLVVWKWLYGVIACVLLTALFAFLGYNDTLAFEIAAVVCTVSTTAAIILTLIFVYQLEDEYHFTSHYSNVVVFTVDNKRPDQKTFDDFFIRLQQTIDNAQRPLSVNDRLVGELKMCRRLKDEKILDEDCYTQARTAIFKNEQYKT